MASVSIVTPTGGVVAESAADRQARVEGYARFRAIVDGYEEPARPSIHDVESVAGVLRDALPVPVGQEEYAALDGPGGRQFVYSRSTGRTKLMPMISGLSGTDLVEGRSWRLVLSPGFVGLRTFDANKLEQAQERQLQAKRVKADINSAAAGCGACPIAALRDGGSKGEILEWSARSRQRMLKQVCSLDYSEWKQSDGALAMVTLTLPGDWLTVAPDGRTFKRLLKRFEMRWRRAVGEWRCLWKLEFQNRGAPHWHALMRVPALVGGETFERWLSQTWADVVNHPDPIEKEKHLRAGTGIDFSGKDFSDPRRISMYFLGHSSKTTDGKEYQHNVPVEWQKPGKGPGRFWGNPGLSSARVEVELTGHDADVAARILRKVRKARAWKTEVLRDRAKLHPSERKKHSAFAVDAPKPKKPRGRAARKTWNKFQRDVMASDFLNYDFRPGKRYVPPSLGSGGYAVGGWVLVNDGLQLALDLARYFRGTT